MEIITYIVNGHLTHQDSMGTKESLGRGSIQFMTAGTGIRHSEFNHGDEPLRFIQTWIVPRARGLTPNYGSCSGNRDKNTLQHLVSDVNNEGVTTPVKISQDTDAYAAELDLNEKVTLDLPTDRQAYLICLEGSMTVNGNTLNKHDACEIHGGGGTLQMQATEVEETENGKVAHFLMFTMPFVEGSGRSDL